MVNISIPDAFDSYKDLNSIKIHHRRYPNRAPPMTTLETVLLIVVIAFVVMTKIMRNRSIRLEREKYIRRYTFSSDILAKVKEQYPALEEKDLYLVARALRQYFLIYLRADKKTIGMPSRIVDIMWHEFILDTRKYTAFCNKAFGGYFHHIPASKSQKGIAIANSMKLTLKLAFLEENINPANPTRLPLLFAIDEKMKIPHGNIYQLPKKAQGTSDGGTSCCGGIACGGGSSSSDSSSCCGDSGSSGGCGGGCGGGD